MSKMITSSGGRKYLFAAFMAVLNLGFGIFSILHQVDLVAASLYVGALNIPLINYTVANVVQKVKVTDGSVSIEPHPPTA